MLFSFIFSYSESFSCCFTLLFFFIVARRRRAQHNLPNTRPLHVVQQVEYLKEIGDIHKRLEKRLEVILVNQEQCKRDDT